MRTFKLKRPIAFILSLVMILSMLPVDVFAAGSYGTNYPPYNSSFPNTVIVEENGIYTAFQTSSQIYYANDENYLMVPKDSTVRKFVWQGNTWKQSGNAYVVAVPAGRTVDNLNLELYSISNETSSGNPKKYTKIVDCNINIINYNITPDSNEALNRWSTEVEISNFGLAMMPDIYTLVNFTEGDTFDSIRSDFTLDTKFTIGDLDFVIEWQESNASTVVKVNEEEVNNGVKAGYQSVTVNRDGLAAQKVVTIPFRVNYVGNSDEGWSNISTAKLNLVIEPKGSYGAVDSDLLWVAELDLNDYVDFRGATSSIGGANNGFNNVISYFYVGEGNEGAKVVNVVPVKDETSEGSLSVYKATEAALNESEGFYNSAKIFITGSRPSFGTNGSTEYYKAYYDADGVKHENIYEELYNEFLTNELNVVIDKHIDGNMIYYTLADGSVILCDELQSKETLGYWENGNFVTTLTAFDGNYYYRDGSAINIYNSNISREDDSQGNKINQFGVVTFSGISLDEKWLVVPANKSDTFAYAELLVTFEYNGEQIKYRVPFVIEPEEIFSEMDSVPYGSYNTTGNSEITLDSNTRVYYTGSYRSVSTNYTPFDITLYKSSGIGANDWTAITTELANHNYETIQDLIFEDYRGSSNQMTSSAPGEAFTGFTSEMGKAVSLVAPALGQGYIYRFDITLDDTKYLNTDVISINSLAPEVLLSFSPTSGYGSGLQLFTDKIDDGESVSVYVKITEIGFTNLTESVIEFSWNNRTFITFTNNDSSNPVSYTNSDVKFTGNKINSIDDIIPISEQEKFEKTGYTLIGWTSSVYGKTFYYNQTDATANSGLLITDYIVPTTNVQDILTAVYSTNSYKITLNLNYVSSATTSLSPWEGKTTEFTLSYGSTLPSDFPQESDLTRDGYKFLGWYTKDGQNDEWGNLFNLYASGWTFTESNNVKLYARWEPIKYTLYVTMPTAAGTFADNSVKLTKTVTFDEYFDLLTEIQDGLKTVGNSGILYSFNRFVILKNSNKYQINSGTRLSKDILNTYLDKDSSNKEFLNVELEFTRNPVNVNYVAVIDGISIPIYSTTLTYGANATNVQYLHPSTTEVQNKVGSNYNLTYLTDGNVNSGVKWVSENSSTSEIVYTGSNVPEDRTSNDITLYTFPTVVPSPSSTVYFFIDGAVTGNGIIDTSSGKNVVDQTGIAAAVAAKEAQGYELIGWFSDMDANYEGSGTEYNLDDFVNVDPGKSRNVYAKWNKTKMTISFVVLENSKLHTPHIVHSIDVAYSNSVKYPFTDELKNTIIDKVLNFETDLGYTADFEVKGFYTENGSEIAFDYTVIEDEDPYEANKSVLVLSRNPNISDSRTYNVKLYDSNGNHVYTTGNVNTGTSVELNYLNISGLTVNKTITIKSYEIIDADNNEVIQAKKDFTSKIIVTQMSNTDITTLRDQDRTNYINFNSSNGFTAVNVVSGSQVLDKDNYGYDIGNTATNLSVSFQKITRGSNISVNVVKDQSITVEKTQFGTITWDGIIGGDDCEFETDTNSITFGGIIDYYERPAVGNLVGVKINKPSGYTETPSAVCVDGVSSAWPDNGIFYLNMYDKNNTPSELTHTIKVKWTDNCEQTFTINSDEATFAPETQNTYVATYINENNRIYIKLSGSATTDKFSMKFFEDAAGNNEITSLAIEEIHVAEKIGPFDFTSIDANSIQCIKLYDKNGYEVSGTSFTYNNNYITLTRETVDDLGITVNALWDQDEDNVINIISSDSNFITTKAVYGISALTSSENSGFNFTWDSNILKITAYLTKVVENNGSYEITLINNVNVDILGNPVFGSISTSSTYTGTYNQEDKNNIVFTGKIPFDITEDGNVINVSIAKSSNWGKDSATIIIYDKNGVEIERDIYVQSMATFDKEFIITSIDDEYTIRVDWAENTSQIFTIKLDSGVTFEEAFEVIFDLNGHGDTVISNQKVVSGGKVVAPTEPTADGFTFDGWYKEPACNNEWDFDTDTIGANITLYAKWNSASEPSHTCEDTDNDHYCNECLNVLTTCKDNSGTDSICDNCGKIICASCKDTDTNNECDICEKCMNGACTDTDTDTVCDVCGKCISDACTDNIDHICDLCGKHMDILYHVDDNSDYICDVCKFCINDEFHVDNNQDNECDICEKTVVITQTTSLFSLMRSVSSDNYYLEIQFDNTKAISSNDKIPYTSNTSAYNGNFSGFVDSEITVYVELTKATSGASLFMLNPYSVSLMNIEDESYNTSIASDDTANEPAVINIPANTIEYNKSYLSFAYQKDFIDINAYIGSLNPTTNDLSYDVMNTTLDKLAVTFGVEVGTAMSSSDNIPVLGVSVNSKLTTNETIKSIIEEHSEKVKVYYIGYTENSGSFVKCSLPTLITAGTTEIVPHVSGIENKDTTIMWFYIENTEQLDATGEYIKIQSNVTQTDGTQGYIVQLFTEQTKTGSEIYETMYDTDILQANLKTALITPELKILRLHSADSYFPIATLLSAIGSGDSASITGSNNLFTLSYVKDNLSTASATNQLYSVDNFSDYTNSAYYIVDVNNPNGALKTDITVGFTNIADTDKDHMEFVGYLKVDADGESLTFYKESPSSTYTYSYEGTSSDIFPVLRITTKRTEESDYPFGTNGTFINTSSYLITLTENADPTAIDTAYVNKVNLQFSILRNTIASFVETFAGKIDASQPNYNNLTPSKVDDVISELGDYYFIRLDENDTLLDLSNEVKLITSYYGTSIKWSIEKISGNSDIRITSSDGSYDTASIVRNGTNPTFINFIGTMSYEADGISTVRTITIPACIPGAAQNHKSNYQQDTAQYVGAYIKSGSNIKVSVDSNLSNRFAHTDISTFVAGGYNQAMTFAVDMTKVQDYSMYVISFPVAIAENCQVNGFAVGNANTNFEMALSKTDGASPIGSAISGNWATIRPNVQDFTDSYIVTAKNATYTTTLDVKFNSITTSAVGDGDTYKVKTYTSESLFLGKYSMPQIKNPFIVMNYGEYVVLMETDGNWYVDNKGLHPGNKTDNGWETATVKMYVAPDWEHLMTFENISAETVFENVDTDAAGDISNLIYTSHPIMKLGTNTTIIFGSIAENTEFTRAFSAPGIVVNGDAVQLTYDGNTYNVVIYKNSDLTYYALDRDDSSIVHIYNQTEGYWKKANLNDNGLSITVIQSLQRLASNEAYFVSDALMSPTKVYLPNPYSISGGSNGYDLKLYVDIVGAYYMVATDKISGNATVYTLDKYAWIVEQNTDLVQSAVAVSDIPEKYQEIYHATSSGRSDVLSNDYIFWMPINLGSIPNLPKPPVTTEEAVLIYDGEYKTYVNTTSSSMIVNANNQEIITNSASMKLTCYVYKNGSWTEYSNDNITPSLGQDGYYHTGIYLGNVLWTNKSLSTSSGTIALQGQGLNAFGYYSDGFANLEHMREGSSEKEYFIWDKTTSSKSIMIRLNGETNNIIPLNRPVSGKITMGSATVWNEEDHIYEDVNVELDAIIPVYSSSIKFGTIYLAKQTAYKEWYVVEDGVSQKKSYPESVGSTIKINAVIDELYETNIPDDRWFDKEQLLADTTAPILDYAYVYNNMVKWVGHDDTSKAATEVVSGLGEHPYGITFNSFFPYGEAFSAWQLTNKGEWVHVSFDGGIDTYGNPSLIATGTTLWFDDPIALNVFNYNIDLAPEMSLMIMDAAGNVSTPVDVVIPEDTSKCDLGVGELPEDIKQLLEGAEEGNTNDIDAPVVEYIYMYRGMVYIYAEDYSVNGRDVSGLAPYPYMINSSSTLKASIVGNDNRLGTGQRYSSIPANTNVYIVDPVINIGEIVDEITLKIRVADAANYNGNSGPSDGTSANLSTEIKLSLDAFSNNTVLYGTAPESIVQMLEKEKLESGQIGTDNEAPVIKAIYVGKDSDGVSLLGVIATDNSKSPCEYSFELRASGYVDWQTGYEVQVRAEDTGIARVYVRDKAGNETSATVFIDTTKSSIVYGDPGSIPDSILEKYNIEKTDTTPPVITSVYVYNGKIYVTGYDETALHTNPYGWRPTEDMIISSDFVGIDKDGLSVVYYAGNLIPSGTLMFNNAGCQEIQLPMSFEVILRDSSNNQSTMTFFISKDNTCLYGNPPKEIAHLLDKSYNTDADGLIAENDNRLLVQMHSDFNNIAWNEFDYEVKMYDGEGRLVYSVEIDEGGQVWIPYYNAGDDITVIQSANREKDDSELLSKTLTYTTKDTKAPVITNVYVMSGKIYVEAYDDTALADAPYSFTFENVVSAMEDRFSTVNYKKVLAGDRVIIKVKDAAGNTSSMTLRVGDASNKTLMTMYGQNNETIFSIGDNKSIALWGEFFKNKYGVPDGYTLYTPKNNGENPIFSFGEIDATVTSAGDGFIRLYKDNESPIIYIPAKVVDDGSSGRTAIVQQNSYSNFLLMFKDKLIEEFGTANGIHWTVETNELGASKQENFFYTSRPGIYKVVATRGDVAIDYYYLVEEDIETIRKTIEMDSDSIRYVYLLGDIVTFEELFDFNGIEDPGAIIDRIVVEDISDGIFLKDGSISMNTTGRKSVTLLNLISGDVYTVQFQVVELHRSIGDYTDIASSWARTQISLLAQNGILEKSYDKKFKPNNPVSVKEFISYLDRMQLALNLDIDYSKTELELGVSTKDWDYFTLSDFAGLISDDVLSNILYDTTLTSPITRGQAVVLISKSIMSNEPQRTNTSNYLSDVYDSEVENAIYHLASVGMITIPSDGKFRPDDELTRQELAMMLGKFIQYIK